MTMRSLNQLADRGLPTSETVTLTWDQRTRSRLRVMLDDGSPAGIFLDRGTVLRDGTCLLDAEGRAVRVVAAPESVSTISSDDPTLLARACYHLGNRHVPLQVAPGWARYRHDHVLDDMVRLLGLEVVHEDAAFEPEAGAYGAHGPGHQHEHDHGHAHEPA